MCCVSVSISVGHQEDHAHFEVVLDPDPLVDGGVVDEPDDGLFDVVLQLEGLEAFVLRPKVVGIDDVGHVKVDLGLVDARRRNPVNVAEMQVSPRIVFALFGVEQVLELLLGDAQREHAQVHPMTPVPQLQCHVHLFNRAFVLFG